MTGSSHVVRVIVWSFTGAIEVASVILLLLPSRAVFRLNPPRLHNGGSHSHSPCNSFTTAPQARLLFGSSWPS